MPAQTRVLLIGGSSHSGKSTLAAALAGRLGWTQRSTDSLARHPGRPWRAPPDAVPLHVAEHYLQLTADERMASVQAHYQGQWPTIEALIQAHAQDPAAERLVLEGSALWPSNVAALRGPAVAAVWLTAADALFEARIRAGSGYATADARGRAMIDAFLERTLAFNRAMLAEVERLGLAAVVVDRAMTVEALAERCAGLIR